MTIMDDRARQHCSNITIIEVAPAPAASERSMWRHVLICVFLCLFFFALGYALCVYAGVLEKPQVACCGVIALELDFEFEGESPP